MIKVQFSSIIDGVQAKKDKTLSIRLGTQELAPDDTSFLFDMMGKQLWVAFAETPIENLDVPDTMLEFKGEKTPSQRLRDRMYVFFKKKHGTDEGFHDWYRNSLEKIGDNYLDAVL